MSLFCSKLWEFSAADQILNLGWFKAYLSSLWAFVPHPQTFSSDICFLLRIILAAFPNYGSQLWLSNQFQVRFSRWELSRSGFCVKSRAKPNFCHTVFTSFVQLYVLFISATGEKISWEVLVTSAVVALSGLDGTSKWDFQAHKHSHRHKLVFSMSRALDKSHCHFFSSSASWFICQLSKGFQARERQV